VTGPETAQAIAGLIRLEREKRYDDVVTLIATMYREEMGETLRLAVTVLAEQVEDRAMLANVTPETVMVEMLRQVGLE
jgi:hypothetical protein